MSITICLGVGDGEREGDREQLADYKGTGQGGRVLEPRDGGKGVNGTVNGEW